MQLSILILGLTITVSSFGQKTKHNRLLFSKVLNDSALSYFWKLDSLGSNGFRACASDKIIISELDTVDLKTLADKLGKPNFITTSMTDVEYKYIYFDPNRVPPMPEASKNILYISFRKKNTERFISSKVKWFIEY